MLPYAASSDEYLRLQQGVVTALLALHMVNRVAEFNVRIEAKDRHDTDPEVLLGDGVARGGR